MICEPLSLGRFNCSKHDTQRAAFDHLEVTSGAAIWLLYFARLMICSRWGKEIIESVNHPVHNLTFNLIIYCPH